MGHRVADPRVVVVKGLEGLVTDTVDRRAFTGTGHHLEIPGREHRDRELLVRACAPRAPDPRVGAGAVVEHGRALGGHGDRTLVGGKLLGEDPGHLLVADQAARLSGRRAALGLRRGGSCIPLTAAGGGARVAPAPGHRQQGKCARHRGQAGSPCTRPPPSPHTLCGRRHSGARWQQAALFRNPRARRCRPPSRGITACTAPVRRCSAR